MRVSRDVLRLSRTKNAPQDHQTRGNTLNERLITRHVRVLFSLVKQAIWLIRISLHGGTRFVHIHLNSPKPFKIGSDMRRRCRQFPPCHARRMKRDSRPILGHKKLPHALTAALWSAAHRVR